MTGTMSELNRPTTTPAAPVQAPGATPSKDGAAEVYRRAVEAKPTGFTENPIGAMASAMDKIGRAAGKVVSGRAMEGQDGLADAEGRLKAATAAVKANPGSLVAKQEQLKAGLALLGEMQNLAPNDPRRVKVAQFVVQLATALGATGIPFNTAGMDVRGLLALAAQITSQFGSSAGMQAAFSLEGLLKASMPMTSVAAVRLLDALQQRFGISPQALRLLSSGWTIKEASPGQVPVMDVSSRTLVLDAVQHNASLGVLARAYWNDATLRSPAEKDGFIEAFLKIANQGTVLNRKYREVRSLARHELQRNRVSVLGAQSNATPVGTAAKAPDESADMFAALAVFAKSGDAGELPDSMQPALNGFFSA